MPFLRNAWYCAAWSSEISRTPLARTLLGEPLVLYRTSDDAAVALGDRCPHRYAPLSQGKVDGETIVCPYHGLHFGTDGGCVHNPHGQGLIPPNARVRAYPLVERQKAVWIWTGDVARADPTTVPNLPEMDIDADYATIVGYVHVRANYALAIDNLLDLTHSAYLHGDSVSVDASHGLPETSIGMESDGLYCRFLTRDVPPPAPFRPAWKAETCDYRRTVRWSAPSQVMTKIGVAPAGGAEADGVYTTGYHLLTPETDLTSHYFWTASRQFLRDDTSYDERLRGIIEQAFLREDEPMIAACQRYMGAQTDIFALSPALLETDRASVMAYRTLQRMIQEGEAS